MSAVLEVRGLRHRYDDGTLALDGVDFTLHEGETVALLGPNGSGKTTFALHLNGLLTGEGSVTVCGMRVTSATLAEVRRKIGFVFQDADAQLFLPTLLEDTAYGPLNLGLSTETARERARASLRAVGLAGLEAKAPYHLSAGEKRRAALAGVIAMEPAVLVLDEPTTFLDPPGWRTLVALLRGLPQAKVVISHDVAFARALATRAVFFEKGKVAGSGTVDEVVRRFEWDTAG